MATFPKVFVDGVLVNYGDDLFPPPYRSPKAPPPPPRFFSTFPNKMAAALMVRNNIKAVVNRVPEAMVKITSKKNAGRGMSRIAAHLDYISRNGKVDLEDGEGHEYEGKRAVNFLKESWNTFIPDESPRREAFNVTFSMPSGTPAETMRDAVRDFLQEEFENYPYLFALHTDTKQPHVHVCIQARPKVGKKRLNPRKADLQNWRTGFSEKLRDHGIQANATPRRVRGQIKESVPQRIYHMAKREAKTNGQSHDAALESLRQKRIKIGHGQFANNYGSSDSSLSVTYRASHYTELNAWRNIAQTASQSEIETDKALAKSVVAYLSNTPLVRYGGGFERGGISNDNDEMQTAKQPKR